MQQTNTKKKKNCIIVLKNLLYANVIYFFLFIWCVCVCVCVCVFVALYVIRL